MFLLYHTSDEVTLLSAGCMQDDGATPLYIASLNGHDATVAALLSSGAAVNQGRTVGLGLSVAIRFVVT